MWWFVKKVTDDGVTVVYAYGYETNSLTGKISYNRETEKFYCLDLAENDTKGGSDRLASHIWNIVTNENAPDERMIAIG